MQHSTWHAAPRMMRPAVPCRAAEGLVPSLAGVRAAVAELEARLDAEPLDILALSQVRASGPPLPLRAMLALQRLKCVVRNIILYSERVAVES